MHGCFSVNASERIPLYNVIFDTSKNLSSVLCPLSTFKIFKLTHFQINSATNALIFFSKCF